MIERTLIARSTSVIASACVCGTPYTMVSTNTMPASTKPIPAGVNGKAVSNEPVSATKNAPLIPRCTSLKPNAPTTSSRRTASVVQINPVRTTRPGSARSPTAENTPSSKRSYRSRTRCGRGSRVMIRRPKLRIVSRPPASTPTTPTPIANTTWTSLGSRPRKLTKPAIRPSTTIANRSRMRSMKTVPKVRLSDTGLLIFSR